MVVGVAALVAGVILFKGLEALRCDAQMHDGPNSPNSNCGYQLGGAVDDFRYAIDDGSQRILYMSGGSGGGPTAIRMVRDGAVIAERTTEVLKADRNIDVCRNQPPRDARWWSVPISDDIAREIRAGTATYGFEGEIDGAWRPLRIHDSGCKWHGHA